MAWLRRKVRQWLDAYWAARYGFEPATSDSAALRAFVKGLRKS